MLADTIAAIATPPGRGGVGIIRISGNNALAIAKALTNKTPAPHNATFTNFFDQQKQMIDSGLLLYFEAPHSFTGEHVVELQGHGGPVVMDLLLQAVLAQGARLAKPGEFSERAFLNDKIDLTQAEAIADLIDSASTQAARSAVRSLQGEFSKEIKNLLTELISLRVYVEAAIDFPEEEIDFLADKKIKERLENIINNVKRIFDSAKQGVLLQEGMTVVIAGRPNVGKSSLLNQLSGRESAIVTHIPGTTRDVLREHIQIEGMPLHIIDTAGLRDSEDAIEQEGIRRAKKEMQNADRLLLLIDASTINNLSHEVTALCEHLPINIPVTIIKNKIDLTNETPHQQENNDTTEIALSAKTGEGIDLLISHLKNIMGFDTDQESNFIARRRHINALQEAEEALFRGQTQLIEHNAGELLAEELRHAQHALSKITGEFTNEDLLGEIFSSFCLGK